MVQIRTKGCVLRNRYFLWTETVVITLHLSVLHADIPMRLSNHWQCGDVLWEFGLDFIVLIGGSDVKSIFVANGN
jgi:hypothetical protein